MSGISDEQFDKILRNSLLSSHWLAQLVAPGMIERRSGSIILISSVGGLRSLATIGAYKSRKRPIFSWGATWRTNMGRTTSG